MVFVFPSLVIEKNPRQPPKWPIYRFLLNIKHVLSTCIGSFGGTGFRPLSAKNANTSYTYTIVTFAFFCCNRAKIRSAKTTSCRLLSIALPFQAYCVISSLMCQFSPPNYFLAMHFFSINMEIKDQIYFTQFILNSLRYLVGDYVP